MNDFTFLEARGVSFSLREDIDGFDPSQEPSPEPSPEPPGEEEGGLILNGSGEKSGFSQMTNLFIIVVIILILAVIINFILRKGRFRLGRVPNAPSPEHTGIPPEPADTNSLPHYAQQQYGLQQDYYDAQFSNQPLHRVPPPRHPLDQNGQSHYAYQDQYPPQQGRPHSQGQNAYQTYIPFR